MIGTCSFCGGPSTLLCDGRIYTMPDGKKYRVPMNWFNGKTTTCDTPVCRGCAKKIADVHIHARGGCRWDTRDLCQDCAEVADKMVEVYRDRSKEPV